MKKDYLVIFASHIDNEDKKEIALKTLKSLKSEEVDVCISTHCGKYISELSNYCNYVLYDYDNSLVTIQDYYDNVELLNDTNCSIGSNIFWLGYSDMGYTEIYTYPEYSKAALMLLRNGIHIAKANEYKWIIYIEYDIPSPISGYKKLIEDNIKILDENKKLCFLYEAYLYGPNLIWPAFAIFDTDTFYNSDTMLKSKWYKNQTEWIKYWGNSGFEYCLEHCIKSTYTSDMVLRENIHNSVKKIWGVEDYANLSKSYTLRTKSVSIIAHLYPNKTKNGNYTLYFTAFNTSDLNKIYDVKIKSENTILFNISEYELHPNAWWALEVPVDGADTINLSYKVIEYSGLEKHFTQKINTKDLEKIHKYIMKFEYFNK
jgi:hypothetical protein